jgi:hypothetical protein
MMRCWEGGDVWRCELGGLGNCPRGRRKLSRNATTRPDRDNIQRVSRADIVNTGHPIPR